jgi:hypothetical protein
MNRTTKLTLAGLVVGPAALAVLMGSHSAPAAAVPAAPVPVQSLYSDCVTGSGLLDPVCVRRH